MAKKRSHRRWRKDVAHSEGCRSCGYKEKNVKARERAADEPAVGRYTGIHRLARHP